MNYGRASQSYWIQQTINFMFGWKKFPLFRPMYQCPWIFWKSNSLDDIRLWGLNWSGLASFILVLSSCCAPCTLASLLSFNSDTLKSTYWSCWFVVWSESLSLTVSFGTECILGSTVSGLGFVGKLSFCAAFGDRGGFGANVKVDLVKTQTHADRLILH